jgi:hypothetical protein
LESKSKSKSKSKRQGISPNSMPVGRRTGRKPQIANQSILRVDAASEL